MDQEEFPHNRFPLWLNRGPFLSPLTPVPGRGGGIGVRVTLLLLSVEVHSNGKKLAQAGALVARDYHSVNLQYSVIEENSWAAGSSDTGKTGWPEPGAWNLRLRPMVLMSSRCGVQWREGEDDRDQEGQGSYGSGARTGAQGPLAGALFLEAHFSSALYLSFHFYSE